MYKVKNVTTKMLAVLEPNVITSHIDQSLTNDNNDDDDDDDEALFISMELSNIN